jgi:signal transduction histidine kinase
MGSPTLIAGVGLDDRAFAQLVSLACHDLRTPLATVHGFARTLVDADLGDPAARYLSLMDGASVQLGELIDRVSLVARIEAGRYEPNLEPVDLAEVAAAATARTRDGVVTVSGPGGNAVTERQTLELALHDLARCVIRHGAVPEVSMRVDGRVIELEPVPPEVAPILLGQNLRDLGAAVAVRAIEALGGSVSVESERLVVRLSESAGQAAAGAASPAGS